MKIVKGDTVLLRSGRDVARAKDKNVRGRVMRVLPRDGKVVVEGLNMVTKHQKPKTSGGAAQVQSGGRIKMEAPVPASRVMLICSNCDKPTRVGMRVREDKRETLAGSKTVTIRERVCKKCGEVMPRPTDINV